MKTTNLFQVELHVDTDGPIAFFYRRPGKPQGRHRYTSRCYRARDIDSPSAKVHFIKRVTALQMALCKAAQPPLAEQPRAGAGVTSAKENYVRQICTA